jgi:hypothetical protein
MCTSCRHAPHTSTAPQTDSSALLQLPTCTNCHPPSLPCFRVTWQGVEAGNGQYRGVPYREHSFLTNPRLSPIIRDSNATVVFTRDEGESAPRPAADGGGAKDAPFNFGSVVEVTRAGRLWTWPRARETRTRIAPRPRHAHHANAVFGRCRRERPTWSC